MTTCDIQGSATRVQAPGQEDVPGKITGQDEIAHGGLPKGRLTTIMGGPGSGKTLLGLQTLH